MKGEEREEGKEKFMNGIKRVAGGCWMPVELLQLTRDKNRSMALHGCRGLGGYGNSIMMKG